MIRIICDNCSKALDVEDSLAGQKVKCPACGDVNVVPAIVSGSAAAQPDRAAAAGYPPADGPEVRVLLVRRAMFRAKPMTFTLLLLGLLGGAGAAIYFMMIVTTPKDALAIIGGVVALACLLVLLVWKVTTVGEMMQITNKRTIEKTGIFSKSTSEVMHRDIRNIQLHQSFRERIFNVGKIVISSAAEEDSEIVATDIPNPRGMRDVIDLYRKI